MGRPNEVIKEIITTKELPFITVERTDSCSGFVIKQERIVVQGYTLKECKTIYDKIKKDNKWY